MTDTALIKAFIQGDTTAFNRLVWRYEKPLYNFIYRYVGNRDTAQDLCQTAFIRMFKEIKKLRDPEKYTSWMYRIALNLCRDEFKKRKRRYFYSLEETFQEDGSKGTIHHPPPQETQSPQERLENQEIGEILKMAMSQIPEEQRVVIVMKQYQGLKFTEIAEILQQPINTIKSRLYYGLRALKQVLESSDLSKEVLLHEM
jgi:RNA polymerase sigma-70 factor (ECF subfamily)